MWSKFLSLLRRFFTTNILLKVIAVLLGFVFWVLLSNIQDPTVSRTLTSASAQALTLPYSPQPTMASIAPP